MKPDLGAHDSEIETRIDATLEGGTRYRVSCSCGFNGLWRKHRQSARRDRDALEDRRAAGEA